MIDPELFKAIFSRKSIRKYMMTPLSADIINKVQSFADSAKPLIPDIHYTFDYLSSNDVKNLLPIKAPHYICLYSEKKEGYLMNAGFLLQQIDLFLSANHLGSCWLGMAKPSKDIPQVKSNMNFVIMLAFGDTEEQIHRMHVSEFKRKSLSDITNITDAAKWLEPVRLAPSASNSQPWFFSGNSKEIIVSREKLSLIMAPLYGRMNQIDIGIALCHLMLILKQQDKSASLDFNNHSVPDHYEFMAKVTVKENEQCLQE